MNKAVHALVYVILAVAIVAVFFEMKLFEKKELLTDSNEQLRLRRSRTSLRARRARWTTPRR